MAEPFAPPAIRWTLLTVALAVCAVVIVRCAWVTEDAYIMFRTADNAVNGFGLRWNVAERVQTYTCPLWLLLYLPVYAITREPFYTCLGMQLALSAATLAVLVVGGGRRAAAATAMVILWLSASKAFVDYSTSGLENPLSHLLLASFAVLLLRSDPPTPRRILLLATIASLGAVNRLDASLLYAPGILAALWKLPRGQRRRGVLMAFIGALPLVLWLAFATFYYGFPLPNTAYAKLQVGIDRAALALRGLAYLKNSLHWDPLTLALIATGAGVALARRSLLPAALAAGMALYLLYIVKIGADYMSGRFLTPPLIVAAVLVGTIKLRHWRMLAVWTATVAIICLLMPRSPWRSDADYGELAHLPFMEPDGTTDERMVFFPSLGLLAGRSGPHLQWAARGLDDQRSFPPGTVIVEDNIGLRCYYGGPKLHYLDPYGLGDPLLARLPPIRRASFRIGHFRRALPWGYDRAVVGDPKAIADPALATYFERLCVATRAPLWSKGRWAEVLRLNTGHYDHLIDRAWYAHPHFRQRRNGASSKESRDAKVAFPPPPRTQPAPVE